MKKLSLAVNILFFVNGFLYASFVSRLPRIQEMYALSNGGLGMALLSASIGAVLSMPFTGWLIIQYGSKKLSWLAGMAFCLLVPLLPLLPNALLLGILFFLMGIITGIMDVSMNSQAVLVEKVRNKPIMASFHAIFSAGMMLGAGCGALFVQLTDSLFIHLLLVSVLCIGLVGWGRNHLLEDKKHGTDQGKTAFRLPSKALLGIGFIAFCCMLGEGAMADWGTIYLEKVTNASETLAPIGLAAFSFAMMLGRFGGDWARAFWGDKKLMLLASITALSGLSLAVFWATPYLAILGLFVTGMGLATIVPIAYSTAGKSTELTPGVGIAMVTTIGYTGFMFGPPIIGFLGDIYGLRIALSFVLLLFVVMSVLSFLRMLKI